MSKTAVLTLAVVCFAGIAAPRAEEVRMRAERAFVITFESQTHKTYKLLGADNAGEQWETLKDGIIGTGGEVTIFYKSEADQKLFFKVETSEGAPGQRSLLSLANLDISNKDLSGYDLEGEDLRGFNFTKSLFHGANLSAADLSEARFSEASFVNADLSQAVVTSADLLLAKFNGANLEGIRFVGCYAAWADFRGANLKGVQFDGTVLREANFAGQTLTNFSFRAAGSKWPFGDKENGLYAVDFSGADLSGADLSRNNSARIRLAGANIDGVNFEGSSLSGVALAGRTLGTVFLRGIIAGDDWSGVNANGAQMPLATVEPGWKPAGSSFHGTNLEGLTAGSPDFQWGITNVSFRNANLRGAYLEGMIFRDCDFTGADLSFANVVAADFSGCVGLNPEQPGMEFGGWPQNPPPAPQRPQATILPDGSPRVGTNAGSPLAPTTAPAKLQLVINDSGTNATIHLQLDGWTYSEDGAEAGTFTYQARGRKAVLKLSSTGATQASRTLLFTSPTAGELYNSDHGTYRIGTFGVPQEPE